MVVFWIDEVKVTEIVCTKGYPSVRRQHQASLLSSTFVGGWDEDGTFTGTYHLTGRSADGPRTITEVIMEDSPCSDRGVPTGETITTYSNQTLYVGAMSNWKPPGLDAQGHARSTTRCRNTRCRNTRCGDWLGIFIETGMERVHPLPPRAIRRERRDHAGSA